MMYLRFNLFFILSSSSLYQQQHHGNQETRGQDLFFRTTVMSLYSSKTHRHQAAWGRDTGDTGKWTHTSRDRKKESIIQFQYFVGI